MKIAAGILVLALLLFAPRTIGAGPEDDVRERLEELSRLLRLLEEAEQGQEFAFTDNPREARVYNVADLTVKLPDFIHPNLMLHAAGAEIDESQPLFGRAEEGERFFSDVDELIDMIRVNVRPDLWDSGDAWIEWAGSNGFLAAAEPAVHAEIDAFLDGLRESVGRMVTVEVRVMKLAAGAAPPPSRLDAAGGTALLESSSIAVSARITGYNGQRVSLYRGVRRSFVQDYDVEVAQSASIGDPIVSILQTGLSFDLRPVLRGEGLVILDIRGQVSGAEEPLREVATASGVVQVPVQTWGEFGGSVTVEDGAFAVLSAGSDPEGDGWFVLVRPRAERVTSSKGGGR